MNPDVHERARRLLDRALVESLAESDRHWLAAHLAECSECPEHAHANERALHLLNSNALRFDPELVSTTQARVRWKARERRENQARLRVLWISIGLSWLLGAFTGPLMWEAIAWCGRAFDVSRAVCFVAFAVCWIAPATVVGAWAAWRHTRAPGLGAFEP